MNFLSFDRRSSNAFAHDNSGCPAPCGAERGNTRAGPGRTARNSALVLGADDFLTKPLDHTEVVPRVRNSLRTRRLYLDLAEANETLRQRPAVRPH